MSVSVTSIIEIFETEGNASILVGDYEIPDLIQVKIKKESEGHFGTADFCVNVEQAEALAKALLRKVADCKEGN
jgi:hypothetical protein